MKRLEGIEAVAEYVRDESRRAGSAECVLFPARPEEVPEALASAAEGGRPVAVQGGRTGIVGGAVPEGGAILNLSAMADVGERTGDRLTVEAGATLSAVRSALSGSGRFFPPDPTEPSATIGGMISTNASGARSYRYGSVRRWVEAIDVVLPSGEAVRLQRGRDRARETRFEIGETAGSFEAALLRAAGGAGKRAAGYFVRPNVDLVDPFIGAEGTLGIVTRAVLRLLPEPESRSEWMLFFENEEEAFAFVRFLRERPADDRPESIEYFDAASLERLRRRKAEDSGAPFFAPPAGFGAAVAVEWTGAVPEEALAWAEGAGECYVAETPAEAERFRAFRHAVPEALNAEIAERRKRMPELTKIGTDFAVPDDRAADLYALYRRDLEKTGMEAAIFGHVGDNHLHVNFLPRRPEEAARAVALRRSWAKRVVEMGGVVSAEHGIGRAKIDLLELMVGREGIDAMRRFRRRFDPDGRLNPGVLTG